MFRKFATNSSAGLLSLPSCVVIIVCHAFLLHINNNKQIKRFLQSNTIICIVYIIDIHRYCEVIYIDLFTSIRQVNVVCVFNKETQIIVSFNLNEFNLYLKMKTELANTYILKLFHLFSLNQVKHCLYYLEMHLVVCCCVRVRGSLLWQRQDEVNETNPTQKMGDPLCFFSVK